MKMTRTAVIYCRISRDRVGAGLGVERQEADCRALAERLGWTVVAVHIDNDLSAYSRKRRPAYELMLSQLRDGAADAVIAWHPDRLHRRVAELETFVTLCENHDVAIQTVQAGEVDLSTASGRMVARMLGAAAQHEIDHSRERMKAAKAQATAAGRWLGGRRSFGYEPDGVTVRPSEAKVLDEAAISLLAGRSLNAVTAEVNTKGFTTTTGKAFDATTLRRVLLKPRNAGLAADGGAACCPAIIAEPRWRALHALLTDPARTTTTGPERKWLGSGLYLCGVCGGTCRATLAGKGIKSYTCKERKCVTRSVEQVDEVVRGVIAARLARPDLADLLVRGDGGDRVQQLHAEAHALRIRLDELAGLFASGDITGAQLRIGSERLRIALAEAEAALTAASSGSVLSSIASTASPAEAFLAAPLDRQRAILSALATVTLAPAKRGRPAGWQPGQPYFDPATVVIEPRTF
jgi:site-specific DNA recombinase